MKYTPCEGCEHKPLGHPGDHRYQHQPWWIRLWRRRYLLRVPHRTLVCWWATSWDLTLAQAWSIERGFADHYADYGYMCDELTKEGR